jgi:hypothetical protein
LFVKADEVNVKGNRNSIGSYLNTTKARAIGIVADGGGIDGIALYGIYAERRDYSLQ